MTLLVVVRCDGCGKEIPSRAEAENAYADAKRAGWKVAPGCIGDDRCPSCSQGGARRRTDGKKTSRGG